ncbi:ATPase, partial [Nonomuraea sp. NPDC049784]
MASPRLVLAVDGGNSKTDVAVVSEDGQVLATGRSGGFAPQRDGVEAAVSVVEQALSTLPPPAGGFDHVSACLAGADLPVEEESLSRELAARG